MQRRILPICIVITMSLACQTVANAANEVRFFFWGTQARLEGFQAAIETFHRKYPELKVRISPEMVSWGDYREKLPVMMAAGELPDVVLVGSGATWNGLIAPLEDPPLLDLAPYMKRDNISMSNFDVRNWPFLRRGEKIIGIPWDYVMGADQTMGYNIKHFDEAGIAHPDEKWTWHADFIPVSRKLTQIEPDGRITRHASNFIATFQGFWRQVLYTYGGRVFNEDMTECVISEPRAYAAFEMIRSLREQNLAVWTSTFDAMTQGRISMGFEWWTVQQTTLGQMTDPYGISLYPQGPAGHGIFRAPLSAPVHSLVVSRNTRYPREAWMFIRFVTTEPESVLAWRGIKEMPRVSYRPLVGKWSELLTPAEREYWLPIAFLADELAVDVDRPVDPDDHRAGRIDEVFVQELTAFYNGQNSIEAALSNAKRRIDGILLE